MVEHNEIYNFVGDMFFYLKLPIVSIFHFKILDFGIQNFRTTLDINMVYTKFLVLNVTYKFIVENFLYLK